MSLKGERQLQRTHDPHPGSLLLSPLQPVWSRGWADMLRLWLGKTSKKGVCSLIPSLEESRLGKTPSLGRAHAARCQT